MTGPARRKLIGRLMRVTRIALRVLRHTSFQALLVEAMTESALGSALGHLLGFHLPFHFFRVRVIPVREPLESKLNKPCWEFCDRSLAWRRLVTDDAHLALRISEVPGVTLNASRMAGQYRFCFVV